MVASSGKAAVENARKFARYEVGMCQKFIRGEAWHLGSLYGSAIDAWYGAMHKHPEDRNPPLGAPMFYKGGQYGHIVINTGQNDIRSTDCPSSGQVSEAATDWPVNHWGQDYLGWTEDLNGVMLPLDKDDDEMKDEDFQRIRKIVAEEVKQNNGEAAERVWIDDMTVTKPDGSKQTKDVRQVIREVWQKIAKDQ